MISQAIEENYSSVGCDKILEYQCQVWVGARMKFKDIAKEELNAAWEEIWSKGLASRRD